jgi:hypothetical protein
MRTGAWRLTGRLQTIGIEECDPTSTAGETNVQTIGDWRLAIGHGISAAKE